MSNWTQFWDMNSGGGQKEKFKMCFIEAPEAEAKVIFYNRFGHNPERVTCTCCGEDYSISDAETLAIATAYHRGCISSLDENGVWHYIEEGNPEEQSWRPYITLEDYCNQPDVLVIRADEISADERKGHVPAQGFVWMD